MTTLIDVWMIKITINCFTVEKLWLFGLFFGDKGDNIDMWTQYVDDKNYHQNKSN